MAKRLTIESCLNEEPHYRHNFRPGIFNIGRKVQCPGIKPPVAKPAHKHKFISVGSDGAYSAISFVCDHPMFKSCNAKVTMHRHTYEALVMEHMPFTAAYIRWSEAW